MGFCLEQFTLVGGSGSLLGSSGGGFSGIAVWPEVRGMEVAQREGAVGEGQTATVTRMQDFLSMRPGSRLLRRWHS